MEEIALEGESEEEVRDSGVDVPACAPAVIETPPGNEQEGGTVEAVVGAVEEGVGNDRSEALVAIVVSVGIGLGFGAEEGGAVQRAYRGVMDADGEVELLLKKKVEIVLDGPAVARDEGVEGGVVPDRVAASKKPIHSAVIPRLNMDRGWISSDEPSLAEDGVIRGTIPR